MLHRYILIPLTRAWEKKHTRCYIPGASVPISANDQVELTAIYMSLVIFLFIRIRSFNSPNTITAYHREELFA